MEDSGMRLSTITVTLILLTTIGLAACKTAGVAVTPRGQVMTLNVNAPQDLPEQGTGEIVVEIGNRGVNQFGGVDVRVNLPRELVVLSHHPDRGLSPVALETPSERQFHYRIGNLNAGETVRIRYDVRVGFGTLRETDEIEVTAWHENLPGDRLIETRRIRLR
jgi:hypothetical protein